MKMESCSKRYSVTNSRDFYCRYCYLVDCFFFWFYFSTLNLMSEFFPLLLLIVFCCCCLLPVGWPGAFYFTRQQAIICHHNICIANIILNGFTVKWCYTLHGIKWRKELCVHAWSQSTGITRDNEVKWMWYDRALKLHHELAWLHYHTT